MVERLDQGASLGPGVPQTYPALHALVGKALFRTHVEGKLKVSGRMPVSWLAAVQPTLVLSSRLPTDLRH